MVATSALHNALESLNWVDLLNPEEVEAALSGCLIQRVSDREIFARCFRQFFVDHLAMINKTETLLFKASLKEFADDMRKEGTTVNHILADYLEGDAKALLDELYIEGVEPDKPTPAEGMETRPKGKKKDPKEFEKLRNRVRVLIELAEDFSARSFHLQKGKGKTQPLSA